MAKLKEAFDSANWAKTLRILRKEQEWPRADLGAKRLNIHPQAIVKLNGSGAFKSAPGCAGIQRADYYL